MNKLPIVIPLEEDELLGSWIYRLARANLITDIDTFIRTYVRAAPYKRNYIKCNELEEFIPFYKALDTKIPMSDLFLQTTCYAGIAPFISSGQQITRLNHAFRKTYHNTHISNVGQPLTAKLHWCEQCQQEELNTKGFWYYHRAHQLPGVKVCHKHGSLLKVFTGWKGQEFNSDASFEISKANAPTEIMQQYAVFFKKLLDLAPDGSYETIRKIIRLEIAKLPCFNSKSDFKEMQAEMAGRGMDRMFTEDLDTFFNKSLLYRFAPTIENLASMSLFLFGSAEAFVDRLHSFPCNEFQERLEKDGYELIGPYKNNIVQLRHECGIEFCTTTEGFANGWSCPKCDSRKREQEILENLISYIDGGSYKPLLNYQGMNTKIEFLHTDCRKTTSMTPLDLLLSGKRCQCQATPRKQALIEKLNENSDFQLIQYADKHGHLTIRHLLCGQTFAVSYNYFISNMRCPHCESGVQAGIKKRMSADHLRERIMAIVGDEYSLESTDVKSRKTVKIRHNKCGFTQAYNPGAFLMGRRCSHCRSWVSIKKKEAMIPYLSNGEYEVLSISKDSMCEIRNTQSHQILKMQWEYIVQELIRPTPSPVLPCKNPNRAIEEFHLANPKVKITVSEQMQKILEERYGKNDAIFFGDLALLWPNRKKLDSALNKLIKKGILIRVGFGVYKWYDSTLSNYDIAIQRYAYGNGTRKGYFHGYSFAYEIGLTPTAPTRTYITTNLWKDKHGRTQSFLGCSLYICCPKTPVTGKNWKILQLLDMLTNLYKYTDFSKDEAYKILCEHIVKHDIQYEQAEPYFELYPDWAKSRLAILCNLAQGFRKEDKCEESQKKANSVKSEEKAAG